LVSTLTPAVTAICRAALICPAVSGCGVSISQPSRFSPRWYFCTACSVITVFGAEVPDGRLAFCAITGFATQSLLAVHAGGGPFPLR
jgi:hypothetical protein